MCMDLNDPGQRHDHTYLFEELHMEETISTIYSRKSPPVTNIRNESRPNKKNVSTSDKAVS